MEITSSHITSSWIILILVLNTCTCQQHNKVTLTSSSAATLVPKRQMVSQINARQPTQPFQNFDPNNRAAVVTMTTLQTSCGDSPCRHGGTCQKTNNLLKPFVCTCPPLSLGNLCEIVVFSPPKVILVNTGTTNLKISWTSYTANRDIYGYKVQFNKFGSEVEIKSGLIHPNTTEYTVEGLDEDSKYTVCVNLVFDNMTEFDAILREQCLEIKTEASNYLFMSDSMLVIGMICSSVLVLFLITLVMIYFCYKKQSKQKDNSATFPSMSWRKSMNYSKEEDSFVTSIDDKDPVQFSESMFYKSTVPQNQTNNSSSDSSGSDVFIRSASEQPLPSNPCQAPVRSSSDTCYSNQVPPAYHRASGCQFTSIVAFEQPGRHKRTSSVPHATFRELPPSISNHMMRSPTTRDKDATDEFDMGSSYFLNFRK